MTDDAVGNDHMVNGDLDETKNINMSNNPKTYFTEYAFNFLVIGLESKRKISQRPFSLILARTDYEDQGQEAKGKGATRLRLTTQDIKGDFIFPSPLASFVLSRQHEDAGS